MPSRRAFLMTALSAGAVSSLCLITSLLRPREGPDGSLPGQGQPTPSGVPPEADLLAPPDPAARAPEPPEQETQAALALGRPPGCTEGARQPVPRASWGAQPPLVAPGRGGEYGPYHASSNPNGWLVYDQALAEVLHTLVVHHSALPLSDGPREIQRLHQEEKGFADVGYQFLIDEAGSLYEGRPLNVRGAHTYGQNYGTVGICLIGNFEEIVPSREQLFMLRALLACLASDYPRVTRLAGHRDFNTGTLCPGANLAPLLPGFAAELGLAYGS